MVGLVSASFLIGAVVPVTAAPIAPLAINSDNSNMQLVQERWHRPPRGPGMRPGRPPVGPGPAWGPGMRPRPPMRPGPAWGPGMRPRPGYWNGYRGYPGYRPGYRLGGDGWWYPLAAFGLGAIVGGALAPAPAPVYGVNNRHVQWCYNRYRSYRASDNTFQPNNGPRRQCISPYL